MCRFPLPTKPCYSHLLILIWTVLRMYKCLLELWSRVSMQPFLAQWFITDSRLQFTYKAHVKAVSPFVCFCALYINSTPCGRRFFYITCRLRTQSVPHRALTCCTARFHGDADFFLAKWSELLPTLIEA